MMLLHVLSPTTYGDASTNFDASRIEYLMLNADSDNVLWAQNFFFNAYNKQ